VDKDFMNLFGYAHPCGKRRGQGKTAIWLGFPRPC